MGKELKKYNISWEEYRKDPTILIKKSSSFRQWFFNTFKDKTNEFTWYNNKIQINLLIKDLLNDKELLEKTPGLKEELNKFRQSRRLYSQSNIIQNLLNITH